MSLKHVTRGQEVIRVKIFALCAFNKYVNVVLIMASVKEK